LAEIENIVLFNIYIYILSFEGVAAIYYVWETIIW